MKNKLLALLTLFALTAHAGTDPSNTFKLGDGNPAKDKNITINQGTTPYPALRWSATSSTLQFSNDGVNYSDLGSGSGSGQGFNVLVNPDFESGIVQGFSHTGGTLTAATSGSNLLLGKTSAVFTANGTGQIFASAAYTVPNGLAGKACSVSTLYKGGSANLSLQAFDGTNVLATAPLPVTSLAQTVAAPFLCPLSGTIQWRIISSGAAGATSFDTAFLGQNVIQQVSQATYYGGVVAPTGCTLSGNSVSFADLADSGTCAGYSLKGNISSFANANGQANVTSLPPGEYLATFQGQCSNSTAGTNVAWAVTDGTTYSTQVDVYGVSGNLNSPCTITAHFSYTSAGTHLFKLQESGATATNFIANGGEFFQLYRFPSQAEQAVRPETINWNIQATLSGATIDLGTANTAVVGPFFVLDGGNTLVLDQNNGSIPAQQPCTGTNAPTSSGACSAGFNVDGVAFTPPSTGKIEVCHAFNISMQGASNSSIYDSYQIVETAASNDSTIIATGANKNSISYVGTSTIQGVPVKMCEIFNIASIAPVSFRLQYFEAVSNSPTAHSFQANATLGSTANNSQWTVRPVTQNIPAPILVGSVVSPSSGVEFSTRAQIATCTSDPCTISTQSGSWLSAVNRSATGSYTVHISSGTFSAGPTCTFSNFDGTNAVFVNGSGTPTSSTVFVTTRDQSGTLIDPGTGFSMLCQGPH